MNDTHRRHPAAAAAAARLTGARLGDRLRLLRVAAGLTQTELAGDRFSKEYVSQIERGKTRPTAETVEWLAQRLDVDPAFLASGVSTDERGRVEALLARAEALSQGHRYKEAIEAFEEARAAVAATNSVELDVRTRSGEAWARMQEGDVRTAIELLNSARVARRGAGLLGRRPRRDRLPARCLPVQAFERRDRGRAPRRGARRSRSARTCPCDGLRSDIFHWRSRCHRRQRDFEAAREDVERALELAQGVDDRRKMANAYFQASLVAERTGHWVLSRNYAEQAKKLFQELDDERNVGRLLNNLGGLSLLLGKPEQAIEQLKASFAVAVEVDSQGDAAQAMGGLATVHLKLGDWEAADEHARQALQLLEGREDFLDEIGQSQLVLGRSLLERGRLDEAEESLPRRRRDLRAVLLGQPPRQRLGRPRRPRRAPWGGRGGSTALSERC